MVISQSSSRFNQADLTSQESAVLSSTTDASPAMIEAVKVLLTELGEDPAREGLLKTPKRVAEAMRFLTSGYPAKFSGVSQWRYF